MPVEGKAALVDVDTPEALIGVKAEIEERARNEDPGRDARGQPIRRVPVGQVASAAGRHHMIVHTGTGLLRSHRRNAQI